MKNTSICIGLLWLFAFFPFFHCKTLPLQPNNYSKDQIRFGQGGGISGLKTEYALLDNGHLFQKMHRVDSFELIQKFDATFANQMKENIELLNLKDQQIYSPGDLYYFIELYTLQDTSRWVWGNPQDKPAKSLVTYYNTLFRTASIKKK